MTLYVNSSYTTKGGYLIPRSHMKSENGEKYCIVQLLEGGAIHYTSRHITMTSKELRKALGLPVKERIEII